MKNIICLPIMILLLSGCDIVEKMEESASIDKAKNEFKKLCLTEIGEELIICGSESKTIYESDYTTIKSDPSEYDEFAEELEVEDIYNLHKLAINMFSYNVYEYKSDISGKEVYSYMIPGEDGIKRGDCEDYTITFIEDGIEKGLFKKGEVSWKLGVANEDYHAWALVKKNNKEYIFDTLNYFGIIKEKAYENNDYKEIATIYKY